jgi:hypothetical protein
MLRWDQGAACWAACLSSSGSAHHGVPKLMYNLLEFSTQLCVLEQHGLSLYTAQETAREDKAVQRKQRRWQYSCLCAWKVELTAPTLPDSHSPGRGVPLVPQLLLPSMTYDAPLELLEGTK